MWICFYLYIYKYECIKNAHVSLKHTRAVDLLHVKCCKNMQTQPHRCHEILNIYKTMFFNTVHNSFFMQFSSDIVKVSPSDDAFCLVRFKFPVCCCCFTSILWGTSFSMQLHVFWYCESFYHWWSPLLLGEVVQLLVFFCLFHKAFWRKSGIKHKLRMLAYLSLT